MATMNQTVFMAIATARETISAVIVTKTSIVSVTIGNYNGNTCWKTVFMVNNDCTTQYPWWH